MNALGPDVALIEALRDPQAYPHAVERPVRVIETHVSWVLLTGPYAYKVKKPLKLSFLDYSSAGRREQLCREELRLNRRFAPELYVDVATIRRCDGRIRVDGDCGEAVEHAVRMVQFDTREELDALVERGLVTGAELAALGTRLAAVHEAATPVSAESDYGTAARIERVTLDNFSELATLALPEPIPSRAAMLRDWVGRAHDELGALLSGRLRDGHVRECHGDLHCGNIVRWRRRLVAFDGIEFDAGLRYVDVASDIAFLTMDLAVRGRNDLRHAALNSWAAALGDYEALRLLPYYEVYRALVRAKVAALRCSQQGRESQAQARTVLRYLDWANARTRPTRPSLLITCGLSGSGKTRLARHVARQRQALHVRSDVERKRLAGLGPLADSRSPPDGGIYTREFNARTYERLARCATDALTGGESVIVDAAFLRRNERAQLRAVADALGAPCAILHCTAPLDLLKTRVAARRKAGRDASEADVALLDRQPTYWEPLDAEEQAITIPVDTTLRDAQSAATAALRRRFPAP